jgi:hypothetical protein
VTVRPTIDWTRLRLQAPASGPLEWPGLSATDVGADDRAVLIASSGTAVDATNVDAATIGARLATFRAMIGQAADRLLRALMAMTQSESIAALPRW